MNYCPYSLRFYPFFAYSIEVCSFVVETGESSSNTSSFENNFYTSLFYIFRGTILSKGNIGGPSFYFLFEVSYSSYYSSYIIALSSSLSASFSEFAPVTFFVFFILARFLALSLYFEIMELFSNRGGKPLDIWIICC